MTVIIMIEAHLFHEDDKIVVPIVKERLPLTSIPTTLSSYQPLHQSSTQYLPTQLSSVSSSVSSQRVTLSSAVLKYAKYLRTQYTTYLGSIPDKVPFTLGTEYVTLTLVKNEKQTQRKANGFIHGNVDQMLAAGEEVKVEDILKADEKTRFILIEGEPGIGKSTLTIELCHQWQNGSLLQQFSLVLLLKFREEYVQTARDIRDLFYHPNEELRDEVVKEIEDNSGEGVLFILDGFDEFPAELQKKSRVMDIIRNPRYLPAATILVTSRPSSTAELQPLLDSVPMKHIQIAGFTNESIHNAAFKTLKNHELFSNFSKYVSVNPIVKVIMYNPLHCSIILNMYKENFQTGRPIPHTLTQLYTELSRSLISSYLTAKKHPLAKALPEDLKDFPKEIYPQLLAVGELAYNGTVTENKELFDQLPGNTTGLGLLIKHHSLYSVNVVDSYNFFHKSLQEYMAAFYISQKEVKQQREFLEKHVTINNITMVIKFVAGLTKMKGIGWSSFAQLMTHDINSRFATTCFYEAGSEENCDTFGKAVLHKFETFGFSDYDMHALGYAISVCGESWTLDMFHTPVTGLEMLSYGLKYNKQSDCTIYELNLAGSPGIIDYGNFLLQIPLHILQKIEYLDVSACNLSHKGFRTLALCVPELHSLKALRMYDNPGGPGSLVALMKALETLRKFQTLSMERVNIGMEDISALSAMIKASTSLTELEIGGGSDSTPEIERELVKTLLLPAKHAKIFAHKMDSVEVVGDFSLPQEQVMDNGMTVLGKTAFLKDLALYIDFNQDELENLLLLLKENDTLETLQLFENMQRFIPEPEKLDPRIIFTLWM